MNLFVITYASGSYSDRYDVHYVVDSQAAVERHIAEIIKDRNLNWLLLQERRKDEDGQVWIIDREFEEVWLSYAPYQLGQEIC